jgi:hypothetical protein
MAAAPLMLHVMQESQPLRAPSHTRLRARDDYYTSSTLIGGEGGARPSSLLPTRLEGPTEHVNGMQDGCRVYLDGFLHGIEWIVFHGHLDCFQKPFFGSRFNTTGRKLYFYHV